MLVTQLGAEDDGCLTVTVRNTRSKASITLALVRSSQGRAANGDLETANTNRYFQNYFRVADADLDLQDDTTRDARSVDGVYTCDDDTLSTEITTPQVPAVTSPPGDEKDLIPAVYPAPAQILARDGDKLTITADTWVQELHVDGTGPEFESITPANKTIQDSGTLRIAFTVRDDGSGLRHDGEFLDMPPGSGR